MPRLAEVVRAFGVEPRAIRRVAHRANTHWSVEGTDGDYVLRRYADTPLAEAEADWEHALVVDLVARGWPAPAAVAPPRPFQGALWLLMRRLPGRASTRPATAGSAVGSRRCT